MACKIKGNKWLILYLPKLYKKYKDKTEVNLFFVFPGNNSEKSGFKLIIVGHANRSNVNNENPDDVFILGDSEIWQEDVYNCLSNNPFDELVLKKIFQSLNHLYLAKYHYR